MYIAGLIESDNLELYVDPHSEEQPTERLSQQKEIPNTPEVPDTGHTRDEISRVTAQEIHLHRVRVCQAQKMENTC